MMIRVLFLTLAPLSTSATLLAQTTTRPLAPVDSVKGAVTVGVADFAALPDIGDVAARMMLLVDEPGTRRFFVNDMRGPIYTVSYDGRSVSRYVDINDSTWGVQVESQGRERGMQSFAFHPQFAERGSPGYGKFYTWADSRRKDVTPDYTPGGGTNTHHTVLHEWTAKTAESATYDGEAPRELLRLEQPFANHNGGMLAFNPHARAGNPDFGLLYVGVGDGGSGGDPLTLAQNLASPFGKILRIDPVARNATNGKYGIPASNPFAGGRTPNALGEIYAYGLRNPQRFAWDPSNGTMYASDIGQNIVEEVSVVKAGANLGWNTWEGSFRYAGREGVNPGDPRSDTAVTYPVVEYMHGDPLLISRAAVTGLHVVRSDAVPPLRNKVLLTDLPSGVLLHFDADRPPNGGSEGLARVLLRPSGGQPTTLLELVRAKTVSQNKQAATRADLRLGAARDGRVFLLNKADGMIRVLTR
jgi:hypothetical protein